MRWINFNSLSFSRYHPFWSRYIFVILWASSCYFRHFRMYLVTISISTCAEVSFSPAYNGKFYRTRSISPFLLVHGRSTGVFDATFPVDLSALFFIILSYSYEIMIMKIFAQSSKSSLMASRAIKSNQIHVVMHHIAQNIIGVNWFSLSLFFFYLLN